MGQYDELDKPISTKAHSNITQVIFDFKLNVSF